MKIYDFTNKKREFGRVAFSLTLDKKRKTERVIIGTADEMRRCLEHGKGEGDVYYDETLPLGSFLINFESDKNGDWNKNHLYLRDSFGKSKVFPITEKNRKEIIAPAVEFLQNKYSSGEPSVMFAAIRTWDEYLYLHNHHKKDDISDTLTGKLSILYKPFMVYGEYRPWHDDAVNVLSVALRDAESSVELWYPVKNRLLETVVTYSSFLPIIFYYMNKLNEWGYSFRQCKACNIFFLAENRHYEVCSGECRKQNAVNAKQKFNEKTKDDESKHLYDATYQHWYNRRRSLLKNKTADPDMVETFMTAFRNFRNEAAKRKKALQKVKKQAEESASIREEDKANEKAKKLFREFQGWLAVQYSEADKLFSEITQKRHDT